jgi:hypothetical protein
VVQLRLGNRIESPGGDDKQLEGEGEEPQAGKEAEHLPGRPAGSRRGGGEEVATVAGTFGAEPTLQTVRFSITKENSQFNNKR